MNGRTRARRKSTGSRSSWGKMFVVVLKPPFQSIQTRCIIGIVPWIALSLTLGYSVSSHSLSLFDSWRQFQIVADAVPDSNCPREQSQQHLFVCNDCSGYQPDQCHSHCHLMHSQLCLWCVRVAALSLLHLCPQHDGSDFSCCCYC